MANYDAGQIIKANSTSGTNEFEILRQKIQTFIQSRSNGHADADMSKYVSNNMYGDGTPKGTVPNYSTAISRAQNNIIDNVPLYNGINIVRDLLKNNYLKSTANTTAANNIKAKSNPYTQYDIIPALTDFYAVVNEWTSDTTGNTTCNAGCTGFCAGSCANTETKSGATGGQNSYGYGDIGQNCASGCGVSCKTSCSGRCAGACEGTSAGHTTPDKTHVECGECVGSCVGACRSTCSTGCGENCTGQCESGCSSGCRGSCKGCSSYCQSSSQSSSVPACLNCSIQCVAQCSGCGSYCGGGCLSSCGSGCTGFCEAWGCVSLCWGSCEAGCTLTCGGSCTGSCDGKCSRACGEACNTSCVFSCHGQVNAAASSMTGGGGGSDSSETIIIDGGTYKTLTYTKSDGNITSTTPQRFRQLIATSNTNWSAGSWIVYGSNTDTNDFRINNSHVIEIDVNLPSLGQGNYIALDVTATRFPSAANTFITRWIISSSELDSSLLKDIYDKKSNLGIAMDQLYEEGYGATDGYFKKTVYLSSNLLKAGHNYVYGFANDDNGIALYISYAGEGDYYTAANKAYFNEDQQ